MKVIPREAKRITYSTEIRTLKYEAFTEIQRALVRGCLLGDGCLIQNWSATNYRMSINHSARQKEYIDWKYALLQPFVRTPPRLYKPTNAYRIQTVSHSELSAMRRIWYPDGSKIIPVNIKDVLRSRLTVATWFMDDGNIRKSQGRVYGYYLNTQSFSRIENEQLAEILGDIIGGKVLVLGNHGYYRLYIGADRERFKNYIQEHVIPSMQYKLG